MSAAAQYLSLSNNSEYKFTTAEGDEVSISFADAYTQKSAGSYQQNSDNESFSRESVLSTELAFSISVNGELNFIFLSLRGKLRVIN